MAKRLMIILLSSLTLFGILGLVYAANQSSQPDPILNTSESFARRPAAAGVTWHFEEIDVPGFFFGMGDRSLRLDVNQVPHLVYGGSHLYHAWYQGGTWHDEIVDQGVSVGEGASMALDTAGRPHIAYKDTLYLKLKYAHWDGNQWVIETLGDVTDWNLIGTAIDLDPVGRPCIIYGGIEGGARGLYHAFFDGSEWQVEMLSGNTVAGPSIAIDPAGQIHVSYANLSDDQISYGRQSGGNWSFEEVDSTDTSFATSLALDTTGEPHVAYFSEDFDGNVELKYATRLAGIWTPELIAEISSNIGISLILDGDNVPHIANAGHHYSFDGVDWHDELVPGLTGSFHESIVLDPSDRPIISASHYGGPYQCAHWDGANWIVDTIAVSSGTGSGNAIAVDNTHQLHATYYDGTTDELIYAAREEGVWHSVVITTAPAGYPRKQTGLALDGDDAPHITFGRLNELDYAYQAGDDWLIEMIDDDFDGQSTIAIDGENYPHVAYLGHNQTRYAVRTDGGWQSETVDDHENFVDMALDSTGRPHLVYLATPQRDLYHAVRSNGIWITDTIDGGAWIDAAGIAIDDDDHLHVGYFHKGNDAAELRYAFWDGVEWQTELVADRMYHGERISLDLNEAGEPFMILWSDFRLDHVEKIDGSWSVSRTVSGRTYDFDMAGDGRYFYISLFYESNRGLILASTRPLGLDESSYLPVIIRQ